MKENSKVNLYQEILDTVKKKLELYQKDKELIDKHVEIYHTYHELETVETTFGTNKNPTLEDEVNIDLVGGYDSFIQQTLLNAKIEYCQKIIDEINNKLSA